jgi:pyruvate,water dikinase
VAREYGIPAVLNVPLATQRIPDGSRITLDGDQGLVVLATQETAC